MIKDESVESLLTKLCHAARLRSSRVYHLRPGHVKGTPCLPIGSGEAVCLG